MKLCKNSFHIDEIFVMKNFNFKILFFFATIRRNLTAILESIWTKVDLSL